MSESLRTRLMRFAFNFFPCYRRTGARRPFADLTPHDPTGVLGISNIGVSTDGKTIVYGVARELPDTLRPARPAQSGKARQVVEIEVRLTRIYAMRPPDRPA